MEGLEGGLRSRRREKAREKFKLELPVKFEPPVAQVWLVKQHITLGTIFSGVFFSVGVLRVYFEHHRNHTLKTIEGFY